MKRWDKETIDGLAKRYRVNLINSIAGFKPAALIGSVDACGYSNLGIFSSVFHVGASPALLGMIIRPNPEGADRHTLDNILETEVYTLNHVTLGIASKAHQTSARYPRDVSEFDATGLTPSWREDFAAPFVVESPIQIALHLAEHQPLKVNGTHLVVGAIQAIHCDESLVREDGNVNLIEAHSAVTGGLDSYHSVTAGLRFAYAKPDQPPRQID